MTTPATKGGDFTPWDQETWQKTIADLVADDPKWKAIKIHVVGVKLPRIEGMPRGYRLEVTALNDWAVNRIMDVGFTTILRMAFRRVAKPLDRDHADVTWPEFELTREGPPRPQRPPSAPPPAAVKPPVAGGGADESTGSFSETPHPTAPSPAPVHLDLRLVTPPRDPREGRKADSGKRRFSLLPWKALGVVVDVLEFGARKYAVDNWKHVPDAERRYFDAALRHLQAWWTAKQLGEEATDPETGISHLGHAACCVLFLLGFEAGDVE